MYLSIIKFNLSGFLNFLNIQEILCSTASCFFHKSILSRICSVLQHPVFSRNLFYPGTALLYSIPSFPEIYSFQDILCSAASCLFHKSILSRNCFALQHPVFSRNLDYPGTALLCSILSLTGIFLSRNRSALQHSVFYRYLSIQELLCSAASVFSRNLDYPGIAVLCIILSFPGTALLCSIPSFPGIYSIHRICSAPCSIPSFPGIYSI